MKYRKKPVEIDAVRWFGDNYSEIANFLGQGDCSFNSPDGNVIEMKTLEGVMTAQIGDYIICGIKGEFYPCKPDIFEASYELSEEDKE